MLINASWSTFCTLDDDGVTSIAFDVGTASRAEGIVDAGSLTASKSLPSSARTTEIGCEAGLSFRGLLLSCSSARFAEAALGN